MEEFYKVQYFILNDWFADHLECKTIQEAWKRVEFMKAGYPHTEFRVAKYIVEVLGAEE